MTAAEALEKIRQETADALVLAKLDSAYGRMASDRLRLAEALAEIEPHIHVKQWPAGDSTPAPHDVRCLGCVAERALIEAAGGEK